MPPILFVMTVVLTLLPLTMSQCTTSRCAERGYEPPRWENGALYLETLLSETSKTLLKAMEARLTEHSEAMGLRLAAQSEAMETRLTNAIADSIATMTARLEEAHNARMDAIEDSKENGTKDIATKMQILAELSTAISTRLTDQSDMMKELSKAIDDRFANMTASLEGALNPSMDALEERKTNGTNYIATKMQALAEQSSAMETRLSDKVVALETRLAQQEGSIKAHLTRTIDEKYETLTETLEDTIRNGTCALVPHMQGLVENKTKDLAVKFEEKVTMGVSLASNCSEHQVQRNLVQMNTTVSGIVNKVKERLVAEMGNLANDLGERLKNETRAALVAIEHRLQDNLAHSNLTIRDLLLSLQNTLSADSQDTRELITETYTNLSAQILDLLSSQPVVFLRRMDGSVNFTRPWADYKAGFGDRGAEFWLGLDTLHALTTQRQYKLRVELTDWSGERKWEVHNHFSVGGEGVKYRLSVSGYNSSVSTTRYDWLHYNNGQQFSTIDRDKAAYSGSNCAISHTGGWWYEDCRPYTNPTGVYRPAGYTGYGPSDGGIKWKGAYGDWRPFKELTLTLIPV